MIDSLSEVTIQEFGRRHKMTVPRVVEMVASGDKFFASSAGVKE